MPIIKHKNTSTMMKSAIVMDFSDLNRQAQEILEDARSQAQKLLDEAQQEIDQRTAGAADDGHAQGFQRGLEEGREQGSAEARKEVSIEFRETLNTMTKAWTEALEAFHDRREALMLEAHEDILRFAFRMGTAITNRTVEQDPTIIEDQLRNAISLLNQPTRLTLVIHSDDRPVVKEALRGILEQLNTATHAELVEDDSIQRGGCIVRTAGGEVDARLQTQIDRIAQTLLPASDAQADPESPSDERAPFLTPDSEEAPSEPSA